MKTALFSVLMLASCAVFSNEIMAYLSHRVDMEGPNDACVYHHITGEYIAYVRNYEQCPSHKWFDSHYS